MLYSGQVAQIRITSKEFPFHVIHVAIGTELDLPISYFDALGTYLFVLYSIIYSSYLHNE